MSTDSSSDSSPLQTRSLKRCRGRVLYSSEDEYADLDRAGECVDKSPTLIDLSLEDHSSLVRQAVFQPGNTPSEPVQCDSSPRSPKVSEGDGWVINLDHEGNTSPWNTETEGEQSDTSTPNFKRGRHELTDAQIRQILREEACVLLPVQEAWRRRNARHSVFLAADSRVQAWPLHDTKIRVSLKESWSMTQWTQAFRTGYLDYSCGKVLIYFEMLAEIPVPTPLNNAVLALCRSIRWKNTDCQIYILNLLPKISPTPVLGPSVPVANQHILEAVRNVNRRMGSVFYLSVFEHFFTKESGLLIPPCKHFRANGDLSQLGCMVLRECIFRESGMKSYWFDEERGVGIGAMKQESLGSCVFEKVNFIDISLLLLKIACMLHILCECCSPIQK